MILLKAKDKVNGVSNTCVMSALQLISTPIDLGTIKDDGIEKQIHPASHSFLA